MSLGLGGAGLAPSSKGRVSRAGVWGSLGAGPCVSVCGTGNASTAVTGRPVLLGWPVSVLSGMNPVVAAGRGGSRDGRGGRGQAARLHARSLRSLSEPK